MPQYVFDEETGWYRYRPDHWCGPGIPLVPGTFGCHN